MFLSRLLLAASFIILLSAMSCGEYLQGLGVPPECIPDECYGILADMVS